MKPKADDLISRELDKLIAEKLMGMNTKWQETSTEDWTKDPVTIIQLDPTLICVDDNGEPVMIGRGWHYCEISEYSSRINYAFEVITAMIELGFTDWILCNDEVSFQLPGDSYAHGNCRPKSFEDIPRAICVAALRTIGEVRHAYEDM